MTGPFYFVDTNVLVYARDERQPDKRERARRWLDHLWQRRARLSFQVLQEYYVTATSRVKVGLETQAARDDIRDLLAWDPIVVDTAVVESAWRLQDRYSLSYWDATIVAAARAAGCAYLLTEDLQHGQDLGGVEVVDPFVADP